MLNPNQVQDMIRESALRPDARRARVQDIRSTLAYEADARIASWGVDISSDLLSLTGRVLQPPDVQYARGGQKPRITNGAWNLVKASEYIRSMFQSA